MKYNPFLSLSDVYGRDVDLEVKPSRWIRRIGASGIVNSPGQVHVGAVQSIGGDGVRETPKRDVRAVHPPWTSGTFSAVALDENVATKILSQLDCGWRIWNASSICRRDLKPQLRKHSAANGRVHG